MHSILSQAKEHRLVNIKFGRVYQIEAQETRYQGNQIDFPGEKPGRSIRSTYRQCALVLWREFLIWSSQAHFSKTLLTASRVGLTTTPLVCCGIPVLLSLSRFPVKIPTTRSSR